MRIRCFSVGELQTNAYLLMQGEHALLIDPGDEAGLFTEFIQRENLHLEALVMTHGHFDHIMALGELQQSYPGTQTYMNSKDSFLVERLIDTAQHFLTSPPVILPPSKIEQIPNNLRLNHFDIQVLQTPGHTPGSVCLWLKEENMLFTGDTLFAEGIGRYDFSYSSKKDLDHSLEIIHKLPKGIEVFPGHGESFILGDEDSQVLS